MDIQRITTSEQFSALKSEWNCLDHGVPFRGWAWLASWWNHFGQGKELYLLAVRNSGGVLVGVAPWYLENSAARGRTIRMLGSGLVCSEYTTILATPEYVDEVIGSLAIWLSGANQAGGNDRFSRLELEGIDAGDALVPRLAAALIEEGCKVHRKGNMQCWRIDLPASWEEYVASLSKSHRKQVRRIERRFLENGRAVPHTAGSVEELARGLEVLVELHQKRRRSLGEPGCFADDRFAGFIHEVAPLLLAEQQLGLNWVEVDGRPVAVEFQLVGSDTTFAYQAGVDPEAMELEPGRIINVFTLQAAIERGQSTFDFLRGDEPYKAHWRAQPRPLLDFHITANSAAAQLRSSAFAAGDTLRHWIKSGLILAGMK